jgi:hypothetical protein
VTDGQVYQSRYGNSCGNGVDCGAYRTLTVLESATAAPFAPRSYTVSSVYREFWTKTLENGGLSDARAMHRTVVTINIRSGGKGINRAILAPNVEEHQFRLSFNCRLSQSHPTCAGWSLLLSRAPENSIV